MTPERWQRVSELYEAALDRPAGEREAFLAELCAGDTGLRREVESLLAQDVYRSPLDGPVWVPADLLAADYNAASSQPMRLAAGTRLGPYEIESAIGAGGMGEVYRGRDTRLDRPVAIKVLRPDVAADPAFRARFDREARTISQLDHPNICPLFDVGDHGGVAYLVMPLLDGEPLIDRLRRGPLPLPAALRIAISLASALTYAHGRGVLHRDIKPHNMLSLADGRTMLLDFGIAKPYGLDGSDTMADTSPALTRIGQTLGTLEYMAPEQLAGRIVDGRSDMFSLGIVIAELVTGKHPFRGATPAVTASAILDRPYAGQPEATGAAAELDRIVRRMLALEPGDRFPTMADCLAELRLLEHDSGSRPVVATPHTSRGRMVMLAAIVLLAVAATVFVWRGRSATAPAQTAPSGDGPVAAAPAGRPVVFWLDVRQGESPDAPIVQSLGDERYRDDWRFRVNAQPGPGAHVYVISDDRPSAENPTGLEVLFAGDTGPDVNPLRTTPWFGFADGPARDLLWLVSATVPEALPGLADVVAAVKAGSRGFVADAGAADAIRSLLRTEAAFVQVSRDRSTLRATRAAAGSMVVVRMELQHD